MTWSCSVLGTHERTETILGPFMFCSLLRLGLCFILEGLRPFCSGKVFIWIGQLSQVCWRKILCLESQSPSYGLSSVDCLSFCPPHRNQKYHWQLQAITYPGIVSSEMGASNSKAYFIMFLSYICCGRLSESLCYWHQGSESVLLPVWWWCVSVVPEWRVLSPGSSLSLQLTSLGW